MCPNLAILAILIILPVFRFVKREVMLRSASYKIPGTLTLIQPGKGYCPQNYPMTLQCCHSGLDPESSLKRPGFPPAWERRLDSRFRGNDSSRTIVKALLRSNALILSSASEEAGEHSVYGLNRLRIEPNDKIGKRLSDHGGFILFEPSFEGNRPGRGRSAN